MTMGEFVAFLRRISEGLYEKKKNTFFLFVDEFENTLQASIDLNTPVLQLKHLLGTSHVGFIVTLRKDYWDANPLIGQIIPSSSYKSIQLEKFGMELIDQLLKKRLELFKQRNNDVRFAKQTIEFIAKQSRGNIRNAISIARDAFRNSLQRGLTSITPEYSLDKTQLTLEESIKYE